MRRIDAFLVGRVESACHWFQRLTGKTNYWILGKLYIVLSYLVMAGVFGYFAHGESKWWFGSIAAYWSPSLVNWIFAIAFVPMYITFGYRWQDAEDAAFRRMERGYANPLRLGAFHALWRLLCLGTVAAGIVVLRPSLYMQMITLVFFMQACDPLPRCRSKIGEWLGNVLRSRSLCGGVSPAVAESIKGRNRMTLRSLDH